MMVKIINLSNRYRAENQLVQSINNPHKFYLIFSKPEEADWCRILLKEGEHDFDKKDYFAVDPSGGPFISVGSLVEGYTVTKISQEERNELEPAFQDNDLKFAYTVYLDNLEADEKIRYVYNVESDEPFIYTINSEPREYVMTSSQTGKSYKSDRTF